MMARPIAAPGDATTTSAVDALTEARERTLALVADTSDADLERVHSPLMSPLVWDLGHIAAFEDLWLVHRFGERPLLHEELPTSTTRSRRPARGAATCRSCVRRPRANISRRCGRARSM